MEFYLSAINRTPGPIPNQSARKDVNMIDASNPNYSETFRQIDELRSSMKKLDKNLFFQIPQGLKAEFDSSRDSLSHWIEEIESTLQVYNRSK
jgi:hypothetical protein